MRSASCWRFQHAAGCGLPGPSPPAPHAAAAARRWALPRACLPHIADAAARLACLVRQYKHVSPSMFSNVRFLGIKGIKVSECNTWWGGPQHRRLSLAWPGLARPLPPAADWHSPGHSQCRVVQRHVCLPQPHDCSASTGLQGIIPTVRAVPPPPDCKHISTLTAG